MPYYAPMQKMTLKQMLFGKPDLEFQNVEIPNVQQNSWPVSPMKQQKRIHLSLQRDRGTLRWPPLPSPSVPRDHQYNQVSPLTEAQQIPRVNFAHQAVTPTPSPVLVDDALYNCNIIAQLQGSYEVDTSAGCVQVNVIVPKVSANEVQYAKVHRVSSDGKALVDQRIYDQPFTFNLQSLDGKSEGLLTKGCDMRHSVMWWNEAKGNYIVWRRRGNVTFNLVQVEPQVRRGSVSSICTVSTSPIMAQSLDTPMLWNDENPLVIRPELLQQRTPVFRSHSSTAFYSPTEGLPSNRCYMVTETPSPKNEKQQEEMFQLIKAQCAKNPLLFKKIVDWGTRSNSVSGPSDDVMKCISEDVMKSLSEGRLWITARAAERGEGELLVDSLDDIKGAYQRADGGVWKQPALEACGSGVQHKLFKDQNGFWTIERRCAESEDWQIRAQQLKKSQWIDLKNNKVELRVHIVCMRKILEKLGGELLGNKKDIVRNLDFLFTSCNQAKLSKLKGRNLKHHITNLKVKLEKRRALSFGVQIAHTAETIAQE